MEDDIVSVCCSGIIDKVCSYANAVLEVATTAAAVAPADALPFSSDLGS